MMNCSARLLSPSNVVIVGMEVGSKPGCSGVVIGVEPAGIGVTNAPVEVEVSTAPGVTVLKVNSGRV